MSKICVWALFLFFGAVVLAGELGIYTPLRNNTPWSHLVSEGILAGNTGQYARAAAAYESAVRAIKGSSREDRLELAFALNALGVMYKKLGRPQDAEPVYKKAFGIWRDLLGPRDILTAAALNNLGEAYACMGKYRAARRVQEDALAIHEVALGPTSAVVANSLNNLAVTYTHQHKFAEAEHALQRAIEIGSASVPPHPRLSEFISNLAWLRATLNDLPEAERMFGQIVEMRLKQRGRRHESVALALVNLASCEIRLKRYAVAVRNAAEAIGILRIRLGERHPSTAWAYFTLATAYERMKRIDLAEPVIQLVVDIDRQTVIDPAVRSAHLREYAVVLRCKGKRNEAKVADEMAASIERQDPDQAIAGYTVDIRELEAR